MTAKLRIAVLAIGLLLCTSAFADTYQYTVNYNAVGPVPAGGVIQFQSNSLQPVLSGLNNVTLVSAPTGWSLVQFSTHASNINIGQLANISVIWVLTVNNQTFNNEIVYNLGYGDWALGTYTVTGNSNYGDDSATITVEDLTTETPEPASLALLGSGLIGLAGAARRKLIR